MMVQQDESKNGSQHLPSLEADAEMAATYRKVTDRTASNIQQARERFEDQRQKREETANDKQPTTTPGVGRSAVKENVELIARLWYSITPEQWIELPNSARTAIVEQHYSQFVLLTKALDEQRTSRQPKEEDVACLVAYVMACGHCSGECASCQADTAAILVSLEKGKDTLDCAEVALTVTSSAQSASIARQILYGIRELRPLDLGTDPSAVMNAIIFHFVTTDS